MAELAEFRGLHGQGRLEHSLCGFAPEAFETGDSEERIVFAEPGEIVTCPACRAEINHVRNKFKRYRYGGD